MRLHSLRPQRGWAHSSRVASAPGGFTLLESAFMLVLLTVFSMVCVALWIKPPTGVDENELKWRSEGGDAMKLSPGLPAVDDPDLLPNMTSDTEIRLEKAAPAKDAR